MKAIKYIIVSTVSLLALCACERKFEKTMVPAAETFKAPELYPVSDVVVDQNNNKTEDVVFHWKPADMGVAAEVEYSLYATATVGNQIEETLVGSTTNNSFALTKKDLNGLAVGPLKQPRNATSKISVYLVAALKGLNAGSVKSAPVSFSITTFDPPKDWIFLPGLYNNWGDNIEKPEWRVWEKEGGTGVYRTIVELTPMEDSDICPLKLYMDGKWLGISDGYTATWEGADYGDKDGNWGVKLPEKVNMIEFNKAKKQASRKYVGSVSLIGDFAPSNWSENVDFVYDHANNIWVSPEVTFEAGKEFLVRLGTSWDYKFGGGTEKSADIKGGVELEQSGSASNIKIPEAGTYVMTIYANRTPIVLVMTKK